MAPVHVHLIVVAEAALVDSAFLGARQVEHVLVPGEVHREADAVPEHGGLLVLLLVGVGRLLQADQVPALKSFLDAPLDDPPVARDRNQVFPVLGPLVVPLDLPNSVNVLFQHLAGLSRGLVALLPQVVDADHPVAAAGRDEPGVLLREMAGDEARRGPDDPFRELRRLQRPEQQQPRLVQEGVFVLHALGQVVVLSVGDCEQVRVRAVPVRTADQPVSHLGAGVLEQVHHVRRVPVLLVFFGLFLLLSVLGLHRQFEPGPDASFFLVFLLFAVFGKLDLGVVPVHDLLLQVPVLRQNPLDDVELVQKAFGQEDVVRGFEGSHLDLLLGGALRVLALRDGGAGLDAVAALVDALRTLDPRVRRFLVGHLALRDTHTVRLRQTLLRVEQGPAVFELVGETGFHFLLEQVSDDLVARLGVLHERVVQHPFGDLTLELVLFDGVCAALLDLLHQVQGLGRPALEVIASDLLLQQVAVLAVRFVHLFPVVSFGADGHAGDPEYSEGLRLLQVNLDELVQVLVPEALVLVLELFGRPGLARVVAGLGQDLALV